MITGKNVKEGAEISFSSSPDIGFTPQFFRDGNNVYALVPISYDVEYSATEQFTIDCDGSSSTLTLNVTEKTYRTQNYGISVDLISKYFDGNAKAAYAEGMAPYYANKESTVISRALSDIRQARYPTSIRSRPATAYGVR